MTISATWLRSGRMAITSCAALALATGLTLASGTGPAAASTNAARATRELYVAGYHFSAPKGTLTVHSSITVPTLSCGSGTHEVVPEVFTRYHVGSSLTSASVQLSLSCDLGIPLYGDAVLQADNHTKTVAHALKPGQTVSANITIASSGTTVEISYSKTSSASIREAGGTPYDGRFDISLLDPPHFSTITFSGCMVDHRTLSSVHPQEWIGVDNHGHVLATPSGLRNGTTFTINP